MEKKKYQIFVSSTFVDLQEERNKVLKTLLDADCIPAGMEYFPAIDEEQFNYIKRVIDESDYYLLIIGGRYGSVHPVENLSYTELEFNYALEQKKPIISLIHNNPGSISSDKTDPQNKAKLDAFREIAKKGRMVKFWSTGDELTGMLATSLLHVFKTIPAHGWIRANEIPNKELLEENHKLRKENEDLQQEAKESFFNSHYAQESKQNLNYLLNYINSSTVQASHSDYKKWVEGYKKLGNSVSGKANYSRMRVVKDDLYLPPLSGANSVELIVEEGATIYKLDSTIGHNQIYYIKDFRFEGFGEPPDVE